MALGHGMFRENEVIVAYDDASPASTTSLALCVAREHHNYPHGTTVATLTLSVIMYTEQLFAGGRLNKKDGLTRYGDSHAKDKTS